MKKIVFTFGRMNPPTIGHEKLANKIKSVAKQENADARIYLSHTQNPTKDPLSYNQKIAFAKKAFGIAHKSNAKQLFQIVKELDGEGYTDVVMVVGSDRVKEFETILKKYNGKGDYDFDSIRVVSAGERDPDAQGVEGMSGSKLRGLAKSGDEETFKSGLASKLSPADKKKVYNMVRNALKEELEEAGWTDEDTALYEELETLNSLDEAVLDVSQRKKRAILMRRLAPKLARLRKAKAKKIADPSRLQQRARKQAINIIRGKVAGEKGQRYKELAPTDKMSIDKLVQKKSATINKLAMKLLPKVKKAEQERAAQARKGPTNEEFEAFLEEATRVDEVSKSTLSNYMKKAGDQMRQGTKGGPRIQKGVDSATKDKRRQGIHRADNKIRKMYGAPTSSSTKVAATNEADVRQDKDIKDKEGTQPAKYYSGLAKSTKSKRDAHFKKGAEKSPSDPSAYKPAPGDAEAKTKPSQYTKKYKQMFGEKKEESDDMNLMVQLRKAVSLRGKDVKFSDGSTMNVSQKDAEKVLAGLQKLKPYQRGDVMKKLSKSSSDFRRIAKINEGEAMDRVKSAIEREKEADKRKHDRMRDQARVTDTKTKNKQTEEISESAKEGLKKKADKSGISYGILKKVYDRGVAAWRTGHRPGTTPQQWGYARVNSFITGGKTRTTADADLWKQVRKESFEEVMIAKQMLDEAVLKIKRREAEVFLLDALKKYLRDATPAELKHVGDMVGKKITVTAAGPKGFIMIGEGEEGEHSWRTTGHYTANGKEWHGDQHVYNGQVMTGKTHSDESKPLFHYKDLPVNIRKKIDSQLGEARAKKAVAGGKVQKLITGFGMSYKGKKYDEIDFELVSIDNSSQVVTLKILHPSEHIGDEVKVPFKTLRVGRFMATDTSKINEAGSPAQQAAIAIAMKKAGKKPKNMQEEGGAGEWGTDKLTSNYKKATPGQESYNPDDDFEDNKKKTFKKMMKKEEVCCEDCESHFDHITEAAEYEGRKVTLNDPFRTPKGPKKFAVYVKNEKGNVVKVTFGDPNMEIKRDDPDRRASFRARHNCDNPGPKWKARYWSCYQWRSGAKVDN